MHRYLVIGHRTLGGAHLLEHLLALRRDDPSCRFHVLVPEQLGVGWDPMEIRAEAQERLDRMLARLDDHGLSATGEVGQSDPVAAALTSITGKAITGKATSDKAEGLHVDAVIVSTLPESHSRWWDVPGELAAALPHLPITHLVADSTVELRAAVTQVTEVTS